jgi:branched-chain amino acid transport system permease protein
VPVTLLIQRVLDGLFNGSIYAALAVAIAISHRATGRVNLAQGEIGLFGGYIALAMASPAASFVAGAALFSNLPGHPFNLWVSTLFAVVIAAAVAVILQGVVMRDFGESTPQRALNRSIALLICVSAVISSQWGGRARIFGELFPSDGNAYINVLGARLRYTTLGAWALVLISCGLVHLFMTRTKAGLSFRALTDNRGGSVLVGIHPKRLMAIGWGISGALAALAASLAASMSLLDSSLMFRTLIYALAAVTLGGFDSLRGAVVGGIIVAQAQTMIPGYLGLPSEMSIVAALIVLVAVLVFRPWGLFGQRPVERV